MSLCLTGADHRMCEWLSMKDQDCVHDRGTMTDHDFLSYEPWFIMVVCMINHDRACLGTWRTWRAWRALAGPLARSPPPATPSAPAPGLGCVKGHSHAGCSAQITGTIERDFTFRLLQQICNQTVPPRCWLQVKVFSQNEFETSQWDTGSAVIPWQDPHWYQGRVKFRPRYCVTQTTTRWYRKNQVHAGCGPALHVIHDGIKDFPHGPAKRVRETLTIEVKYWLLPWNTGSDRWNTVNDSETLAVTLKHCQW